MNTYKKKIKKKIILCILIFPMALHSMEADTAHFKRISVGIVFSPDLCYRTLKPDQFNSWIADLRNDEEVPKFGFTTGLAIHYHLFKRIEISSGIQFSDKGYKTKKTTLGWAVSNPEFPKQSFVVYHHQYVDIPLAVNYCLLDKRVKVFISAGASASMFILQRTVVKLNYEDGHKTKETSKDLGDSKFNFSLTGGLGMSYNITKGLTIKLEPVYRRSINPIVSGISIKEYLYSAGLNAEICLRFTKH